MGKFVVVGAEHVPVAVTAARVVPGFDVLVDGQGQVLAAGPVLAVEELELEGAEEALDDAVVEESPMVPIDPMSPAERRRLPNAQEL